MQEMKVATFHCWRFEPRHKSKAWWYLWSNSEMADTTNKAFYNLQMDKVKYFLVGYLVHPSSLSYIQS